MNTDSRTPGSLLFAALVSAALAGCGNGQDVLAGDLCGQASASTNNVAAKIGVCADQSDVCPEGDAGADCNPNFAGGFSPCFDISGCESTVSACNAADREILEAVVGCQNAYADNSDCTFSAWTLFQTCSSNALSLADGGSALSPACVAANPGTCGSVSGS